MTPSATPSATTVMALVLNSLPSYVEADITVEFYEGRPPEVFHLMVRDRPTYDALLQRRCTCTTTGTEWFITSAMLEDMGALSLDIVSFDNRGTDPLWRIA